MKTFLSLVSTILIATALSITAGVGSVDAQAVCKQKTMLAAGFVEDQNHTYGAYIYDGYIQLIKGNKNGGWSGEVAYINLRGTNNAHLRYYSSSGNTYNYSINSIYSSAFQTWHTIWYAGYGDGRTVHFRDYARLSDIYLVIQAFSWMAPSNETYCGFNG